MKPCTPKQSLTHMLNLTASARRIKLTHYSKAEHRRTAEWTLRQLDREITRHAINAMPELQTWMEEK